MRRRNSHEVYVCTAKRFSTLAPNQEEKEILTDFCVLQYHCKAELCRQDIATCLACDTEFSEFLWDIDNEEPCF